LEVYFGGEEEDSTIAPTMDANQQTYQFGANVPQGGGFNF